MPVASREAPRRLPETQDSVATVPGPGSLMCTQAVGCTSSPAFIDLSTLFCTVFFPLELVMVTISGRCTSEVAGRAKQAYPRKTLDNCSWEAWLCLESLSPSRMTLLLSLKIALPSSRAGRTDHRSCRLPSVRRRPRRQSIPPSSSLSSLLPSRWTAVVESEPPSKQTHPTRSRSRPVCRSC